MIKLSSKEEFDRLVRPVLGLPISQAQRGHGSALILDFGELRQVGTLGGYTLRTGRVVPERPYIKGEFGLMVEWDWRVVRRRRILFASNSDEERYAANIESLVGARVEEIGVEGRFVPELCVVLSDGRALETFATVDPQPQWVLFLDRHVRRGDDAHWLKPHRGRVVLESQGEAVARSEASRSSSEEGRPG